MSSKKTRRGVKFENIDGTLQDADVSKIPDTPNTIGRTLRTRRQLKEKNSSDDDTEKSPKLNESKRQTRRGKGKKVGDTLDDSALNVTSTSKRKRTRKDKNAGALIEETAVVKDQIETQEPALAVSSKANRSRKRGLPKTTKDVANNSDNVENLQNDRNIMSDDNTKYSSNERDNGVIENYDDTSNEDNEVAKMSKKTTKKSRKTPPLHRFLQPRSCNINSPNVTVTPECSPLTVTLTPHRTTKTPRKSPINIGSPKTHSLSPQRLSKTPRKLPVTSDSPATSNQSLTDGTRNSHATKAKRNELKINSSEDKSPVGSTRRASKSPKIVLRASKSKSPRKISTKVKKSPNLKRSSQISNDSLQVLSPKQMNDPMLRDIVNGSKSPILVLDRISPAMVTSLPATNLVTPVVSPNTWKKLIDGVESPRRQKSMVKKRSPITVCGTPLRPVSSSENVDETKELKKSGTDSSSSAPTGLAETKTKLSISSSTPRERIRRSLKLSPGFVASPSLSNAPLSVENFYGKSLKTSTHLYNDNQSFRVEDESNVLFTDDDSSFNISGVKAVDNSQNDMTLIDSGNGVKALSEKADKSTNDTYELAEPVTPGLKEQNKTGNDTYELDEPKTPGLGKKRNLIDINSSKIEDVDDLELSKRVCRVRFASPPLNSPNKVVRKNSVLPRSSTPANKGLRKRTLSHLNNTSINNSKMLKSKIIPPRRRSNSLTDFSSETPSKLRVKKRSLSAVDVASKSEQKIKQNASVNRLSKPRFSMTAEKKVDVKTMSARKVPNFAQIHQRKFAKMESLVDAKKRVEERHNTMINNASAIASTSKTPTNSTSHSSAKKAKPSDATNGAFNRFGYRIRKEEAAKIITKEPSIKRTEEKIAEKRVALKGVRTNRRFELQMKMRNINP